MAQRLNAWTPRHDLKELHLPARPSLPLTLLSANLATRILSSSNKLFACFFFFFFFYILLFIYWRRKWHPTPVFGCAGFLLLHELFSSCSEQGLHSSCCARAYHWGGFSCCIAQALEPLGLSSCGCRALEHSLSSCDTQAYLPHGM